MKAILIDRNNTDAFVSLEDGTVITLPLSQVNNINIGENIHFSRSCTHLMNNASYKPMESNNKLIDFF